MKQRLMEMIKIKAIGPENGGDGEVKRAAFLKNMAQEFNFDNIEMYPSPDNRVPGGKRPNLVATKEGTSSRNLVIIAHMDTVPEGDISSWNTQPFNPIFKDGKIYGRGAEDNGQAIISSLYVGRAFDEADLVPKYNLKVMLVSDEETGSEYGVKHLLKEGLINEKDLVIVPDYSPNKGRGIEVVEKSVLWAKIVVKGVQSHAAINGQDKNANRVMAKFQTRADKELHRRYIEENDLFSPATSTFEPTLRKKNVQNVNTIPGKEIQYFDCRILPSIDLKDVKDLLTQMAEDASRNIKSEIKVDFVKGSQAPTGTSTESDIVKLLKRSIKEVRGIHPKPVGIGGGTVAAALRDRGIPTVVWCTNDNVPHQPNEYAVLDYIVSDCKVFTHMLCG